MIQYLKLIRWGNLLMMGLLLYLLRYALALPLLESTGKALLMTGLEFTVMVLGCLLVAAGGYVINDIEDYGIDSRNKPEKRIAEVHISRDRAFNFYMILSFTGILCGIWLTYVKDYPYIAMINLLSTGLLYFYSTSYKCIPLVGNLVIALLSALLVFMVVLPEPLAKADPGVMLMTGAYMYFSFWMTLLREMIKDIEDLEGDLAEGCVTFAGRFGAVTSKNICLMIILLITGSLMAAQYVSQQWDSLFPFLYVTLFIDLPLLVLMIHLIRATNKSDYTSASRWVKLITFAGIISLAVFYYSFNQPNV